MLMHKIRQIIDLADQHHRKNDHPQLKGKREKGLKRCHRKINAVFHNRPLDGLNLGRFTLFQHLLHEIGKGPDIFRLNVIKEDGRVKMVRIGNRFRSDHDPLAGNTFGRYPVVLLDRQKKMDLQLRHGFNVRIHPAIHTRRA
jgi:hypothetical protein